MFFFLVLSESVLTSDISNDILSFFFVVFTHTQGLRDFETWSSSLKTDFIRRSSRTSSLISSWLLIPVCTWKSTFYDLITRVSRNRTQFLRNFPVSIFPFQTMIQQIFKSYTLLTTTFLTCHFWKIISRSVMSSFDDTSLIFSLDIEVASVLRNQTWDTLIRREYNSSWCVSSRFIVNHRGTLIDCSFVKVRLTDSTILFLCSTVMKTSCLYDMDAFPVYHAVQLAFTHQDCW